jgi:hypothetical protein
MTNIAITVLLLIAALWFYSFISILSNEFKNEKEKTFWIIGIIVVPLLSFFYVFIKKDLLK